MKAFTRFIITTQMVTAAMLFNIGNAVAAGSNEYNNGNGTSPKRVLARLIALESVVADLQSDNANLQTALTAAQNRISALESAQVHWTAIQGIPADIADGDDDTQLTEAQVDLFANNNGYLTAVTWGDISGIPADIADGDDLTSQISWADILNMPSDFADGVDDTGTSVLDAYASVEIGDIDGLKGPHILFEGANVHVRSGSGRTDDNVSGGGSLSGLGNVIVGYNRALGYARNGSHNLIVGDGHGYESYGGFVAGFSNIVSNAWASVSGGEQNIAQGMYSSVTGGFDNLAFGDNTTVNGGTKNDAMGKFSSISGGDDNIAEGEAASIGGGRNNSASGRYASVFGGQENNATVQSASVSGGRQNTASGQISSVSGGWQNIASGQYSYIAGGKENSATGEGSSVSGGFRNEAYGLTANVSAGEHNIAAGNRSSVLGGLGNVASSAYGIAP